MSQIHGTAKFDKVIVNQLISEQTGSVSSGSAQIYQGNAPAVENATDTLTIAQILTGVVSGTPIADITYTLPTAALAVAGVPGAAIGTYFDFSVINTSAGDSDITMAFGTGGTTVGSLIVGPPSQATYQSPSSSGLFRLRFTAVASGSEAYILYRLA